MSNEEVSKERGVMERPYQTIANAIAALGREHAGAGRQLSELLSLHECVTTLNHAKTLDQLLEVFVFTVLGENPSRSAAVFLKAEQGWYRAFYKGAAKKNGDYSCLAKMELLHLQREIISLDSCSAQIEAILSDCNLDQAGFSRFVPLVNQKKLVGLLALGQAMIEIDLEAKNQWLLSLADLFGLIFGSIMDNQSLESVNRVLEQRVFQLQTIRDATDIFIRCHNQESVFRALSQNLMGQFFISRSGFVEQDEQRVIYKTGCRASEIQNFFQKEEHRQFLTKLPAYSLARLDFSPRFAYVMKLETLEAGTFIFMLGPRLNGKLIEADDENLVIALARQASSALDRLALEEQRVENERMLKELELARGIQQQLLPETEPDIEGYEVTAEMRPFNQVGGDFFDWFEVAETGNWGLCLADVSGKSLPASMIMTTTQASLRALSTHTPASVSDIVKRLNAQLCLAIPSNRFVTMFFGILNPQSHKLTYINAGHNPPFLLKSNGQVRQLREGGMVLGMFASAPYHVGEVELEKGDELLIYTDGISELVDSRDEEYGDDRVLDCFVKHAGQQPLSAEKDMLFNHAIQFSGNQLVDDMTVVLIRRKI